MPGRGVEKVRHAGQGGTRAGWQIAKDSRNRCAAGERVRDLGCGRCTLTPTAAPAFTGTYPPTFIKLVRTSTSPVSSSSSALLVTPVRSGVYHPDSLSPAVQQKIDHTLRIEATGIDPQSNVGQAIEATLDDLLKLVDRPAVGCGLDRPRELRGLGVI